MARAVRMSRNPSTSNTTPSGAPQGTMGGKPRSTGARPGSRSLQVGDEFYLWFLVLIEVAAMAWFRNHFRRHHGG